MMDSLLSLFSDNPWFAVFTSAIALASAIAAATPTPKAGTVWAKVYSVIDFLAINVSHAKETGKPDGNS
jgi:hypothetical protein